MSEVGPNPLVLIFFKLRELLKIGCYISPWYANRECKTWASVEDHQISQRKYFPTVMVNISQCLPINNYLTAAYLQLGKKRILIRPIVNQTQFYKTWFRVWSMVWLAYLSKYKMFENGEILHFLKVSHVHICELI